MGKIYTCFIICILVLMMAGCENYDKAIQGIEKGKKFVDTAAKKVTETREGAEKTIGRVLDKDTGKSDAEKSESKENNEKRKGKRLKENEIFLFLRDDKKLVNHFKKNQI
jgi:hypothetical protein